MTMQTYQGVVREGLIQITPTIHLPEGSQAYMLVTGSEPLLEEQIARRKATCWLGKNVGNMLVANEGRLLESEGQIIWRFGAFIAGRGQKPRSPIGYTDVDAHTGNLLSIEQQAQEMMAHGELFARSLLQAE